MEKIPTEGLNTLELLRIQNTHSLKTIPSLLNFRDLQEAYLTHSFHCCAFKYPARHDPSYYAERQRQKDIIAKLCSESSTKSVPKVNAVTDGDGWGEPVDVWGEAVETQSFDRPRMRRRKAIEEELRYKYTPKM